MKTNKMEGLVNKELHIFYVIDTSGSMHDKPIQCLNNAMKETIKVIKDKCSAEKTADAIIKIGVLEFNTSATWITGGNLHLEDLEDFIWIDLEDGGLTNVGMALKELNSSLSRNDKMHSETGNNKPIIIFISDGLPTDPGEWEKKLDELNENKWYQTAIKIGIAMGEHAEDAVPVLSKIVGSTEGVIQAQDLSTFAKLLEIVSVNSALAGSVSHTNFNENGGKEIKETTGEDIVNNIKKNDPSQNVEFVTDTISTPTEGEDIDIDDILKRWDEDDEGIGDFDDD